MTTSIENCQLTVEDRYVKDIDDDGYEKLRTHKQYTLIIKIPIPGGNAVYEFNITEDQCKSLISANQLSGGKE